MPESAKAGLTASAADAKSGDGESDVAHRTGAGRASTRRVLAASLVGTAVETYDFYIYGTAASLVFGALFFPKPRRRAQLLQRYATFAVAFIARPVGAAFFGTSATGSGASRRWWPRCC
jgi:hypothetical protein